MEKATQKQIIAKLAFGCSRTDKNLNSRTAKNSQGPARAFQVLYQSLPVTVLALQVLDQSLPGESWNTEQLKTDKGL